MSNAFAAPHFHDDTAARELIERIRWPNGPVCPHCGVIGHAYATKRAGLYRCAEAACRMDFTVTSRTVMERSKIPLSKWMMGFYLMAASKKGMSAHQLHRALGISYQSAWFMCHRIREAMRGGGFSPLGGEGKIVEADETYYGHVEDKAKGKTTIRGKRGLGGKRPIVSLVERGGQVRSFYAGIATKETVTGIIKENIAKETRLHTDESRLYGEASAHFAEHLTVKHSAGEYVRGDVHTNTIEGYFSIFKRGMKGVYQHCAEKHLHRYLAEFDFRYNHRIGLGIGDIERTFAVIRGTSGKRLTYRQPRLPDIPF
jgi:transposase-like protein